MKVDTCMTLILRATLDLIGEDIALLPLFLKVVLLSLFWLFILKDWKFETLAIAVCHLERIRPCVVCASTLSWHLHRPRQALADEQRRDPSHQNVNPLSGRLGHRRDHASRSRNVHDQSRLESDRLSCHRVCKRPVPGSQVSHMVDSA